MCGLHRDLQPLAPQLLDVAAGGLQAAFDVVDVADWVAEDDLLASRDADAILDRQ